MKTFFNLSFTNEVFFLKKRSVPSLLSSFIDFTLYFDTASMPLYCISSVFTSLQSLTRLENRYSSSHEGRGRGVDCRHLKKNFVLNVGVPQGTVLRPEHCTSYLFMCLFVNIIMTVDTIMLLLMIVPAVYLIKPDLGIQER